MTIAGHFPNLPPTPKPVGCGARLPDRRVFGTKKTSVPFAAGETTNDLTSERIVGRNGGGVVWRFRCECGGTIDALFADVRRGSPRSCAGCR